MIFKEDNHYVFGHKIAKDLCKTIPQAQYDVRC